VSEQEKVQLLKEKYFKRNKGNIFIDVRNELSSLQQHKKYYPEFVKRSKTIQNRDELLFLADEIIQKARKENLETLNRAKQLALEAVEGEEIFLSPAEEISSDKTKNKVDSLDNRESVSLDNSSTSMYKNTRVENYTRDTPPIAKKNNVLSVWKKIQELLSDINLKEMDEAFFTRLKNYTKRALFIMKVIDTYQVFCVNEAWRKAKELGLRIQSNRTVGDLLKDLYLDGFLEMEILPRRNNLEPKLYSVAGYKEAYPEKYERAKNRFAFMTTRVGYYSSKKLHEAGDSTEEIKEKMKKVWKAQKEASKELREEEQKILEEERKKRIERAAITVVKKKQENSSWFDQLSDVQKKYVAEAREKIQREYQADKKHLGERKALTIANKKKKELKQWCKVNFLHLQEEEK